MKIGVLSDIHDNLLAPEKALRLFRAAKIDALIFCGDFCSPIAARALGKFSGTVHCVFGNGDGDRFAIGKLANADVPNLKLHGEYAELSIAGHRLAVTHYPLYGNALARTGDFHAVFSGHTHEVHEERFGKCLWLNPGEILEWKGQPTCAIYDPEQHQAQIITL